MALVKTQYGRFITLEGTLAEVVGALNNEKVPIECIVTVYYDGTKHIAIYRK